jgi:putative endonuclease
VSGKDTTRAKSGRDAEEMAARFLAARGVSIVARNFRCRGGEIDLVGRDDRVIVFVEVRLRRDPRYGGAAASVDAAKQRRIIVAARHWLARNSSFDADCRFDCVLLDALDEARIDWLRNAFATD